MVLSTAIRSFKDTVREISIRVDLDSYVIAVDDANPVVKQSATVVAKNSERLTERRRVILDIARRQPDHTASESRLAGGGGKVASGVFRKAMKSLEADGYCTFGEDWKAPRSSSPGGWVFHLKEDSDAASE